MTLRIVAAVCCEEVAPPWPLTLKGVQFRWKSPPVQFCIWVQVQNQSERPFSMRFELSRASELVYQSEDELILDGLSRVERFVRVSAEELGQKTYRVDIVLNDVAAHRLMVDFGSKESP